MVCFACGLPAWAWGSLPIAPAAHSKEPTPAELERLRKLYQSIVWQKGPSLGKLGNMAEIQVPEGYQFTGKQGAMTWMELNQNPPDPLIEGVMMPSTHSLNWFFSFSYHDTGHVPDDEKDSLDASAILQAIRTGTEASNQER